MTRQSQARNQNRVNRNNILERDDLLIGGGSIECSEKNSTSTNRILMNRRGVCAIPGEPAQQ